MFGFLAVVVGGSEDCLVVVWVSVVVVVGAAWWGVAADVCGGVAGCWVGVGGGCVADEVEAVDGLGELLVGVVGHSGVAVTAGRRFVWVKVSMRSVVSSGIGCPLFGGCDGSCWW